MRILLIGDSVDRMITEDWCISIGLPLKGSGGRAWENRWADGVMRYGGAKGKKMAAYICGSHVTNDSIAFVHIFGSNPTGPYFQGFMNSVEDPFTDTPSRIQHAMKLYYEAYSSPDIIYYNSVQWDLQLEYSNSIYKIELETPHSSVWNESIKRFEKNVNSRLNEIEQHAIRLSKKWGKIANVGIRTALFNPTPSSHQSPSIALEDRIIHAYNNILRKIATERNLTLFDLDNDIWSSVNWDFLNRERDVMRDAIHPTAEKAAIAASKLLRWRYSSFLYDRGTYSNDANVPALWLDCGLPKPARVTDILLITDYSNCPFAVPSYVLYSAALSLKTSDQDQPKHCSGVKRENKKSRDNFLTTIHSGLMKMYFVTKQNGVESRGFIRHEHVSEKFLKLNNIGEADLLRVSNAQISCVSIGYPLNAALFDGNSSLRHMKSPLINTTRSYF